MGPVICGKCAWMFGCILNGNLVVLLIFAANVHGLAVRYRFYHWCRVCGVLFTLADRFVFPELSVCIKDGFLGHCTTLRIAYDHLWAELVSNSDRDVHWGGDY